MDDVRFLSRTDTKFIFHTDNLPKIFERAPVDYKILAIDTKRLFQYRTLYFDTDHANLYLHHHNGDRPRYKVRLREYIDTNQTFLEIKKKSNKERTIKTRIQLTDLRPELSEESIRYVKTYLPSLADSLHPAIWTFFYRITLVNNDKSERITTDIYLKFKGNNRKVDMPFIAISEVKRDRDSGPSKYIRLLKENKIYPTNMSKYCLGTILLKPAIKYNRYKDTILMLKKTKQ